MPFRSTLDAPGIAAINLPLPFNGLDPNGSGPNRLTHDCLTIIQSMHHTPRHRATPVFSRLVSLPPKAKMLAATATRLGRSCARVCSCSQRQAIKPNFNRRVSITAVVLDPPRRTGRYSRHHLLYNRPNKRRPHTHSLSSMTTTAGPPRRRRRAPEPPEPAAGHNALRHLARVGQGTIR